MGTKTETGFTIIETLLFLGVTGLLAVGILVGSGVAIGQQRYRDSVNSLKSYIQDQYNEVTNTVNSRGKSWTCNANAQVSEVNESAGQARGTSNCVLLGRYLSIDNSGRVLTSANVVGYRTNGAQAPSDIAELATNYRLAVSPIEQNTTDVKWSAQVTKRQSDDPMPLSMLVLRSPLSGSLLTFTAEGVQSDLRSMITSENMSQARNLCVKADAGVFMGERLEVRIDAYATNQGAIQIPPEGESVCQ